MSTPRAFGIPAGSVLAPGQGGGSTAPVPAPVVTSLLPRLQAQVAKVKAGTGRARWLMLGDSVTFGWHATNGRSDSLSSQVAGSLSAYCRTQDWNEFGDHNLLGSGDASPLAAYDSRNTFDTSWYPVHPYTVGGYPIGQFANNTGKWNYTAPGPIDSVDIWYEQDSGLGSFDVYLDGVRIATVNTGSPAISAYRKASYTFPRGNHTVSVGTSTGGSAGIIKIGGFETYDSTLPALQVFNAGIIGGLVSDYTDTSSGSGFQLNSAMITFGADLVSIELGANDANAGVTAAAYQAGLQSLITQHKNAGSDVLLIKCHHTNPVGQSYDMPTGYYSAIDSLVASNGLAPATDFTQAGLVAADYFDSIHLLGSGYTKETTVLNSIIRAQI